MKLLRLLRSRSIQQLSVDVPANLARYRSGSFDYLDADPSHYLEVGNQVDDERLAEVNCTAGDHREVSCCMRIYEAMGPIPPYLARDPRVWVYLTHTNLLDYARKRWPIPDDDDAAITHIRKHFFAVGSRGIERDNAASRLWWMAAICSRVRGLSLEEALTAFLHQYDVRANIIERPTTSQSVPVLSALLKRLHESYQTDRKLFERRKFRSVMKELNLRGGVRLLAALDEQEIRRIIDECVSS